LEDELQKVEAEYIVLLKQVPNMALEDVPVGASEAENKIVKEWGEKPQFDFQPKTHGELGEARGLIDKERAAKVAGSRFVYIKGPLVELQFAIISFVIKTLTDQNVLQQLIDENHLQLKPQPFEPVLPPYMLKTEVYDAMDRLEPRDDRYKVGEDDDDLWLEGSAEHTIGPMYKDEVLDEDILPKRYLGYATSFRREAGTYGKDTEGIVRMHQFDKLEMEVFGTPESGRDEHLLMVAIQERLIQLLNIPYRVIQKCTADIGKPNARGIDIEAWMPGQNRYLETHTADYMTDYQARRLKTRLRRKDSGGVELVHTNDATAFALGRTMAAIIENYQEADGHIQIPDALRVYFGDREQL
jgi:seryl-tRNA synthetase